MMKTNSDTPKTDRNEKIVLGGVGGDWKVVMSDFARGLERELNAANERIKRLEEEVIEMRWEINPDRMGQ